MIYKNPREISKITFFSWIPVTPNFFYDFVSVRSLDYVIILWEKYFEPFLQYRLRKSACALNMFHWSIFKETDLIDSRAAIRRVYSPKLARFDNFLAMSIISELLLTSSANALFLQQCSFFSHFFSLCRPCTDFFVDKFSTGWKLF
jgi:hypothetical protein